MINLNSVCISICGCRVANVPLLMDHERNVIKRVWHTTKTTPFFSLLRKTQTSNRHLFTFIVLSMFCCFLCAVIFFLILWGFEAVSKHRQKWQRKINGASERAKETSKILSVNHHIRWSNDCILKIFVSNRADGK